MSLSKSIVTDQSHVTQFLGLILPQSTVQPGGGKRTWLQVSCFEELVILRCQSRFYPATIGSHHGEVLLMPDIAVPNASDDRWELVASWAAPPAGSIDAAGVTRIFTGEFYQQVRIGMTAGSEKENSEEAIGATSDAEDDDSDFEIIESSE
ncbi:hypothetical protein CAEBREN_23534 [Caenorhabditis brenneri]|uniref:Uncharacterized protein n=1 Tax=Caenorhabditis brenneri TaxID=135651 RepID=G0PG58_CAEBE|nr:hypothetical protein CAEBREN_23534 [Caenorhabditis brenneri]